jgi:hypothetical protein
VLREPFRHAAQLGHTRSASRDSRPKLGGLLCPEARAEPLHFQILPHPQGKLRNIGVGAILNVSVNIRVRRPMVAVELLEANWNQC